MPGNAFAAVTAAFLASLVEVTEACTIVLAVGLSKGWRSAIAGTIAALIALSFIVLLLGPLLDQIPLACNQFSIRLLILLLGLGCRNEMSWSQTSRNLQNKRHNFQT